MMSALDQWRSVLDEMRRDLVADRRALEKGENVTGRPMRRPADLPPIPAELVGDAQALMREHNDLISMIGTKMSALQPPASQPGTRSTARSVGRFETVA